MFVDIFSSVLQKYLKDIITMASILRENMYVSPSLELPQDACFGSQTWENIQITSKTLKENIAFYDTMHYRVIFGSGGNLPGVRIVSSIVTWRHYIHLFGSFFFLAFSWGAATVKVWINVIQQMWIYYSY